MSGNGSRPLPAAEAVTRALAAVGHNVYELGTGDCDTPLDSPSDCAGFAICRCYGLRRHRPGFNAGPWSSVEDDININSAIEDADHHGELFERVTTPFPGALLCYPTFRVAGKTFIGHVAIVVDVSRTADWNNERPTYAMLDVVQCRGPNGAKPGTIRSSGRHWDDHDKLWPKPEHRTVMLRVKP